MKRVRFGVIGCGYIAKKAILPALKKSQYAELVAVASRDKTKAESFSSEFECIAENDYESLLHRKDINAVYIATVPSTHEEIILTAAKNGKHILCEKPLTGSYNSAKKIVDHCKKHKVGIFEGFMYQFHSQHKKVREFINDGHIGKPINFTASFGFPPLEKNNFRYRPELGGGALLDAGSYTIHAARHFFQREPINVTSSIYKNDSEVEVHGTVTLDFGKGQTAQLSFGFNNFYRNTYSVWGTLGQVTVARAFSIPITFKPTIILEKQNIFEEIVCDPDDHFLNEISYFCQNISKINAHHSWYDEINAQSKSIHRSLINNDN